MILYALSGFLVLALRKVPVKYIMILACVILLFPYYGHILNKVSLLFETMGMRPLHELKDLCYADIVAINTEGSFMDNLRFRLYEYTVYYRNVEYVPTLIFMILGGYIAGRFKFYSKIHNTLNQLTPVAIVSMVMVPVRNNFV